jgi:hypothetical protein
MNRNWAVNQDGFTIFPPMFNHGELAVIIEALASPKLERSRAGMRHILSQPSVARIAHSPELFDIAQIYLGNRAKPFRATLFDKSHEANWLVAWHQDTALPLRRRRDVSGWGPWSVKAGIFYAHAPASALEKILALRLHLDPSTSRNGPLRVLPGTHNRGVLTDDSIHNLATKIRPVDCLVRQGGVIAMRPLLVHASSKSQDPNPRRVLHIEYSATMNFAEGLELALA